MDNLQYRAALHTPSKPYCGSAPMCHERRVVTICSEMGPGKVRPLTFLSQHRDTSLSLARHRGYRPLIGQYYGHEHYGHCGHLRQYPHWVNMVSRLRSKKWGDSSIVGRRYGAMESSDWLEIMDWLAIIERRLFQWNLSWFEGNECWCSNVRHG